MLTGLLEGEHLRPRGEMRGRGRSFIFGLLLLFVGGWPLAADLYAEERKGPIRIGALTPSWGPPPQVVGLRDGLVELGYREGEDFVIGVRFTQGNLVELQAAAQELAKLKPDLIYTHRDAAAMAAQSATTEIPIVFVGVNDPVGLGLVRSFSRPGGKITGVTDLRLNLAPKRLEVFREVVPGLRRVLLIYNTTDAHSRTGARVHRVAARDLGLELLEKGVTNETEARATLAKVTRDKVDGILRPPSSSFNIPGYILETAAKRSIPTMFNSSFWVERGALASYGADEHETGRQAARLVEKVLLKGVDPGGIPVEVNAKFEFSVNLKVAKKLGLKIPPEVLFRADKVIR